ncbi:HAMP domain-containing sensor histidine kinase [Paracoccus sp. (in: a-proteobacteria)]|uniref:sensor histidine kinase n=1 Tax=Paracoccus sp. TaxID=267 RepID=UPI0028B0F95D|nr:HAMP domain-containing sensor histidine kinase [Paracoccus sp. (in: a-proteobacteria)]
MRPLSLRWRLLVVGGAAILAALGAAAIGLAVLFDRHVERVALADLEDRVLSLIAMVEQDGDLPRLKTVPGDPIYNRPFSGHYWQILLGDQMERSRSLWDYTLPVDQAAPAGARRVLTLEGPRDQPLLAVERSLAVGRGPDPVPMRIVVATDREDLEQARHAFFRDLLPYLGLLAALLLMASFMQITVGLRPLARIGERVSALSRGIRPRIGGDLPTEVIPLAEQLDRLLDDRDRELQRARHRAADLAHGFKTPLQALLGDAERLRLQGETELADSIETVVTAMRRLVDRELARTRLQSAPHASLAQPAEVLENIARVLRRTPAGAELDWHIGAPRALKARINPDDLTEALGALMENAMHHASGRVEADARLCGDEVVITIRDDGPGVPDALLDRLMRRGVRANLSDDGQGIGLAIVADIAEAALGRFSLSNAYPGLCAELRLQAHQGR